MKLRGKIFLILVGALLMATPVLDAANAQRGPSRRGPEARFNRLDTNGDGKISREELVSDARARTERLFGKLDTNGDGNLTQEEFLAPAQRREGGPRGRRGAPPPQSIPQDQPGSGQDAPVTPGGSDQKSEI